jgi:TRAP-type C4-dicarboxylate transport system substrate-binding protein
MKKLAIATALFALALAPLAALAQQPVTIRLGHVGFPGSLFAIVTDEFAKRANAELKGKVDVKVFHSSQLGSDEQMMRGINVGAP